MIFFFNNGFQFFFVHTTMRHLRGKSGSNYRIQENSIFACVNLPLHSACWARVPCDPGASLGAVPSPGVDPEEAPRIEIRSPESWKRLSLREDTALCDNMFPLFDNRGNKPENSCILTFQHKSKFMKQKAITDVVVYFL